MTLSRITYSRSTGLIITGTCFHMYFQSMTFQQKIPSSFTSFVTVLTMNRAFIIIKLLKALCNVLKSERSAYLVRLSNFCHTYYLPSFVPCFHRFTFACLHLRRKYALLFVIIVKRGISGERKGVAMKNNAFTQLIRYNSQ